VNEDFVLRKKISEFAQDMEGFNMARAHKKYVVNYRYVKKIDLQLEEIVMTNGKTIKLGRTYQDSFKEGFVRYHRTL
jgi:DNA-binding LytR/AlgR family response regulator